MGRLEKTVFISYRRTNFPWGLAIFQDLTYHGFDVFFDFTGIASGDFESVILENIRSRAHFIVLLTPSALERCSDPGDWLRREIETALEVRRNIIPLMLENFDFGAPGIGNQLTGDLEALKGYNGLRVPPEYFAEAMGRLREKYLNVPLDAVLHPASLSAKRAAKEQQAVAATAPAVQEEELTAGEWFERGFNAVDPDEQIRCNSEAIRLKPDYAEAFNNRGRSRQDKGDLEGALQDYDQAIRLNPENGIPFANRACARHDKGDIEGSLRDCDEAIRLNPELAGAYHNRGRSRQAKGDVEGALQDLDQAIHLDPRFAIAFYGRGLIHKMQNDPNGAIADFQKYLELSDGTIHDEYQARAEQFIRELELDAPKTS
jgi:tetratricopeptide (TPR) repeat protein